MKASFSSRKRKLNKKIQELIERGVEFIDYEKVYIEDDVKIGTGTKIYPNVYLYGRTKIGENCTIYPEAHIFNSELGNNCWVWPSVSIVSSLIDNKCTLHRDTRITNSILQWGCIVESFSKIKNSIIGVQAMIGPYAYVDENSFIASWTEVSHSKLVHTQTNVNTKIDGSYIYDSYIGYGCKIGPQAHISDRSVIGSNSEITHAQVVRSRLGEATRVKHFSYIGDADIGNRCNIGAGVVFCNYDGQKKNKTIVNDDVFIGSGTMIIAPRKIEGPSIIAAGSVVDKDVKAKTLAIGRCHIHDHHSSTSFPDGGMIQKRNRVRKTDNGWVTEKSVLD